jgi:hypothetical protein
MGYFVGFYVRRDWMNSKNMTSGMSRRSLAHLASIVVLASLTSAAAAQQPQTRNVTQFHTGGGG